MKVTEFVDQSGDEMGGVAITDEESVRLESDPRYLHLIAPQFPPCGQCTMFFRTVELMQYPPGTPANDYYTLQSKSWQGFPWSQASVLASDRNEIARMAAHCGVELTDSIPHIMAGRRMERFPCHSERLLRVRKIIEVPDQALLRQFADLELMQSQQFDALARVWHRGRWWHRVERKEDAPPETVDFMAFRNTQYVGQVWYTTDARNPNWRPLPPDMLVTA
jgi:hypothetical protein